MTIIVPVFNRPELVVRSLDSIRSQTFRPIHLIVVNNGSTDNTRNAVDQWMKENAAPDFEVMLLDEPRKGAAYARQAGLERAVTDKVMFFDSDDTMRPCSVDLIMKAWEDNPDASLVTLPMMHHRFGSIRKSHRAKGNLLERHLVHGILQTAGFAVKREFLTKAGGWRGEFPNWNDFETGTRLLLANPKVAQVREIVSDIYSQKTSITGTSYSAKAGKWEMALDAIETQIRESGRNDISRLLNIVSYRRVILAADYAKEGRKDLAEPLYRQAVGEVSVMKRPLLRFAYHWTRRRLRGAFSIIGEFL